MRRLLLAVALAIGAPAWAQDLVMAVSEGTSGGLDHAQVITKYQGLADVVGRSIRRKVNVVFAREFSQLEEGMKTHRFDFVIARPSDYPARGVQLHGYRFLASAKPDGHCLIIAGKDSGIQKVADLKGRRIVLPEAAAYMTKFCRASCASRASTWRRRRCSTCASRVRSPSTSSTSWRTPAASLPIRASARSGSRTASRWCTGAGRNPTSR
ncbi:phosphate/phosphite/phosphonate ABC transporter substrate-binding protein [Ramlibacter montanisoli]|uniref:phosphate/phosphite/phosphonate ABC transporter substrate-binding protein n=1 Tax=Ramlibacter montanisoli TaxID=2732512 RepID=UPI001C0F2852|nr:PhnD/SsuA/transferrin family substrate-binding protein [Ramlibacter montanisoli]